jgi:ABC-type uncharacterized transport system ATPase subunit
MIELRNLSKTFGDCVANADISMKIRRGSIHAIIGENGAGKSTAMKMLFGIYRPDSGEISIDGLKCEWKSPRDAIKAGIGMVHQHFMLAEPESAVENVLLEGTRSRSRWFLDRASTLKKLQELSSRYQLEVDWQAPIENLPVGVQQRVEILKLLYHEASILILDEPTAVLTPQETMQLFANLKKLASEGKTILLITHKLKEVMRVSDEVSVFRSGRVVGYRKTPETSVDELAALMVGRKVSLSTGAPQEKTPGKALLQMTNLSLSLNKSAKDSLKNLSFSIREGEIVGIAGVEGNGQSELLRLLIHPKNYKAQVTGAFYLNGENALHWNSSRVRASGVGLIPEDRLREGLLLEESLSENFLLGLQRRKPYSVGGWINYKKVVERTDAAIKEYDIKPANAAAIAARLSGGNQQKLIIAREFEAKPKLLIAAQPTRGVDVGAIEFIHQRIVRARNEGAAVLLVSSELDEVLSLSDRVLVLYEGSILAEFKRGAYDEAKIGLYMGGSRPS